MATILITKIADGELGEQQRIKCADYKTALARAENYRSKGIVVIRANRKVKKVL